MQPGLRTFPGASLVLDPSLEPRRKRYSTVFSQDSLFIVGHREKQAIAALPTVAKHEVREHWGSSL